MGISADQLELGAGAEVFGRLLRIALVTGTGLTGTGGATGLALDQAVSPTWSGTHAFSNPVTVTTPTASGHAATKSYVDSVAAGIDVRGSVRAATTATLTGFTYSNGTSGVGATLTAGSNGAAANQDGIAMNSVGHRLLVKNQTDPSQNGIYYLSVVGDSSTAAVYTRALDADTADELTGGVFCFVERGSAAQADTQWVVITDGTPTIGSSAISWTQYGAATAYTAGAGLTMTGNTYDVVAADDSITVNADSIAVKLSSNKGINIDGANGLQVVLANASLTVGAGGVAVQLMANAGIALDAGSGLKLNTPGDGLAIDGSGLLQLTLDGSTLSKSGSGLKIATGGVGTTQLATDAVTLVKFGARLESEEFTGGVVTAYNLAHRIVSSSHRIVHVFRNGVRCALVGSSPSGKDQYTVTDDATNTIITFGTAPNADRLTFDYMY